MTPGAAPVPGGPGAIRRAAHDILSRPEFRPTPKTPLERLRSWIFDQVGHLISRVLAAGPHGILGALIATAVVAAVVVLIVRGLRATAFNSPYDGYSVTGPRRPPEDWLAEAARCEAAGDWHGAVRCRYRALVAELARRGVFDEVPGRTTGEYRRALEQTLPGAATEFADVTDTFERTWYGGDPAEMSTAASLRAGADRVLGRAP